MSVPKTMIPAHAATQNVGRATIGRSYSGLSARRSCRRNSGAAITAITNSTSAVVSMPFTGQKLIARISVPTRTTETMPPRLSTGSVVSFTWLGTNHTAIASAITASGIVTRKTDPQSKCSSRIPLTSGPSAAKPPPIADQSAIDFVRARPDHSAVMSASVVG